MSKMYKPRPIWQELPENFKRDLVGRLDFQSRCQLRRCCSQDKELVDSCPVMFRIVKIEPDRFAAASSASAESNLIVEDYAGFSLDKIAHPVDIVHMLTYVSKHKKNRIGELRIEVNERHQLHVSLFVGLYETDTWKLGVEKFVWTANTGNTGMFLQMLRFMRPTVLASIDLGEQAADENTELVDTEQWTSAPNIQTRGVGQLAVTQVMHCHRIYARVAKFQLNDIWALIKKFTRTPLPVGAYFDIYSVDNSFPLQKLLDLFNVLVLNEPILGYRDHLHTQRFRVASRELILVTVVLARGVRGVICRREHVSTDFGSRFPATRPDRRPLQFGQAWMAEMVVRRDEQQQRAPLLQLDEEEMRFRDELMRLLR